MLVPELKTSQRHPPSPKELGESEVKSRKKSKENIRIFVDVFSYFRVKIEKRRINMVSKVLVKMLK